jgi:putative endonuclease
VWWVAAKDVLGRDGEELAARYLEDEGLVVVSRNWRCSEGELDIVALVPWANQVVFCEVKTRRGVGYGEPVEAVTYAKRRKLRRLASLWLRANARGYPSSRFDVIGVLWESGRKPVIDHRVEAF